MKHIYYTQKFVERSLNAIRALVNSERCGFIVGKTGPLNRQMSFTGEPGNKGGLFYLTPVIENTPRFYYIATNSH